MSKTVVMRWRLMGNGGRLTNQIVTVYDLFVRTAWQRGYYKHNRANARLRIRCDIRAAYAAPVHIVNELVETLTYLLLGIVLVIDMVDHRSDA